MISPFRIAIERSLNNVRSYYRSNDAKRLRRMLEKIEQKKKSNYSPVLLTKTTQFSAYDNAGTTKRLISLNKAYMEEISLMMNGGQYKNQIADLGIQILKVKMTKGLNFLNIYWVSTNENLDEEVANETLKKALEELQQEMGSIRFTSKVPLLRFVRDKRLENEKKLDKIFESADFGKGYTPVYESKVLTQDFVPPEEKFPVMRQDTLGLNHAKIKQQIEDRILKFKAIRIDNWDGKDVEDVRPGIPEKLIKFSPADFYKFYKRRRILEIKNKKKLGNKHCHLENYDFVFENPNEEDDEENYEYLREQLEDEYKEYLRD